MSPSDDNKSLGSKNSEKIMKLKQFMILKSLKKCPLVDLIEIIILILVQNLTNQKVLTNKITVKILKKQAVKI